MTVDAIRFKDVELTKQEVLDCSYSNWYKLLKQFTGDSIIIPLLETFIDYLQNDSIRLPEKVDALQGNSDNEYSDWEEEEEKEEEEKEVYFDTDEFRDLKKEIDDAIACFGAVAPKLNWSAPVDAAWVNPGNTIKCTTVNDILLLLKSSSHISSDLEEPFVEVSSDISPANAGDIAGDVSNSSALASAITEDRVGNHGIAGAGASSGASAVQYELVLRKWIDINPALEFRVFVHDHKIIGVSQRDLNQYVFLEELKEKLGKAIADFLPKVINKFSLSKFILDVYIPRPYNKVTIIDVNPFSRKTSPALFTWNELLLEKDGENDYEFRLVDKQNMGRFAKKEYSESQVPLDMIGAANNVESLVELAREWKKLDETRSGESDSEIDA